MSIFDNLTDTREKREPLPPQKAVVAFGSVTTSVTILWCTPELKLDIEQAGIDDQDVFEHGAGSGSGNPDHGIWVWEGTIKGITYPSTPDHAEEYDVEYPGTWRVPNLEEWEYIKGMTGAYASRGDTWTVVLAGSKNGDGVMETWTYTSRDQARTRYESLGSEPKMLFRGVPEDTMFCDHIPVMMTVEDSTP